MKVYSPSDIASLMKIKESTLRKYSLLLESYGYEFKKNDRKQRYYTDQDVIVLQKLVTLKDNGMTLEESAKGVMLWHRGNKQENEVITQPSTAINNVTSRYGSDITELKETMDKQMELIHKQNESIEELKQYIKSKLEQRDQLLLKAMDETMEIKKELSATTEMNNKKGWFKRLFSK